MSGCRYGNLSISASLSLFCMYPWLCVPGFLSLSNGRSLLAGLVSRFFMWSRIGVSCLLPPWILWPSRLALGLVFSCLVLSCLVRPCHVCWCPEPSFIYCLSPCPPACLSACVSVCHYDACLSALSSARLPVCGFSLHVWLSACLPVCLAASGCLPARLSVWLLACRRVCMPVCWRSVSLSGFLSGCLCACWSHCLVLCLSGCLCLCLYLGSPACRSVHLSGSLSDCPTPLFPLPLCAYLFLSLVASNPVGLSCLALSCLTLPTACLVSSCAMLSCTLLVSAVLSRFLLSCLELTRLVVSRV